MCYVSNDKYLVYFFKKICCFLQNFNTRCLAIQFSLWKLIVVFTFDGSVAIMEKLIKHFLPPLTIMTGAVACRVLCCSATTFKFWLKWIEFWPILQVFDMFAMESKDCLAELEAGLPLLGAIQSFLDCPDTASLYCLNNEDFNPERSL